MLYISFSGLERLYVEKLGYSKLIGAHGGVRSASETLQTTVYLDSSQPGVRSPVEIDSSERGLGVLRAIFGEYWTLSVSHRLTGLCMILYIPYTRLSPAKHNQTPIDGQGRKIWNKNSIPRCTGVESPEIESWEIWAHRYKHIPHEIWMFCE